MRNKKNIIHLLLLALCIMTIGYAAFNSNLVINGSASIESNWDVEITGITSKEIHGGASNENPPVYTKTSATFKSILQSPGDFITYEVTVRNNGDIDARLDDIEMSDENNPAINFVLDGISEGDELDASEEVKFTVTVIYNNDVASQPDSISSSLAINLNYVQK